jgi:pimeloyl-ACP methyl ester carboxylesterase
MVPGLEHKTLHSFDGTRIAYQARGRGPCVVLANGLGGTYEAFRHVYDALGEKYRILCWDYRGLYRSEIPHDLRTLAVPCHASDLARLLEAEHVDRAVFIGWSMGVQVNFEMFRDQRARFAGIVAINGTYGTPFRTALASRLTKYVIPHVLTLMKSQATLVSKISRRAIAWKGLVPAMIRMGMVSASIDLEAIADVAAGFTELDYSVYSDMLRRLGEHDARDVLSQINVPSLIITGDHDVMTPVFTARKMNREILGSRLVVIEGGTHYTPLEFPATIKEEITRFLSGIPGWEPGRNSAYAA